MSHLTRVVVGVLGVILASGCRAATRVSEVPRVDLQLEGGNRGYLVGKSPEAAELKTTRQMVQTDVEIPSFYKPKPAGAPNAPENVAPPETETGQPESAPTPAAKGPVTYDIYTVKKGESLWSIAAKPDVYGKATAWRRIFDANRDVLKSPNHLRPGMTIKIPREGSAGGSAPAADEGTTFKK